jgi:hypothetical protein
MTKSTISSERSQTLPARVDQFGSPSNGGGATRQTSSLLLNHLNTYPVVVRVSYISVNSPSTSLYAS